MARRIPASSPFTVVRIPPAEYGVPVILVAGDDKTCADAATYAPNAIGVPVKECISRYAAICHPPPRTEKDIRAAAGEAMHEAGRFPPQPAAKRRIEVEFDAAHLALMTATIPGVDRLDDRRVGYTSDTMTKAMLCFRAVTTIASSAMESRYG